MKFGKEFKTHLEETIPEWRDKFLCYKPLKKLLKHHPLTPSTTTTTTTTTILINLHLHLLQQPHLLHAWFLRILNQELEKFNDFYVDKEEDFVIRFQVLSFSPPPLLLFSIELGNWQLVFAQLGISIHKAFAFIKP